MNMTFMTRRADSGKDCYLFKKKFIVSFSWSHSYISQSVLHVVIAM
jgi:hypothetical protein